MLLLIGTSIVTKTPSPTHTPQMLRSSPAAERKLKQHTQAAKTKMDEIPLKLVIWSGLALTATALSVATTLSSQLSSPPAPHPTRTYSSRSSAVRRAILVDSLSLTGSQFSAKCRYRKVAASDSLSSSRAVCSMRAFAARFSRLSYGVSRLSSNSAYS